MAESNVEIQQTEVASLKDMFPGQCRVINGIGEFSQVITIQPKDQNIVYKFQLTAQYPGVPPNIIIRAPVLSEEMVTEVRDDLDKKAKANLGRPMIITLLGVADGWFMDRGVDLTEMSEEEVKQKKPGKGRKGKKGKKSGEEKGKQEESDEEKKPSMKTAEDVIKRIQWDTNLQQDQFLVGYIDRFKGIQEKYFTAFSWEDLASVDYTVLAIPQHRIQYFKYQDVVFWDKNKRLDNMFGSAGSGITIADVIANYEAEQQKQKDQKNQHGEKGEEDSDSSDDDDIQVTIGGATGGFGGDFSESDIETDEEYDNNNKEHWKNKTRPNYFIALRIQSEEVVATVENIQDSVLEYLPHLDSCCVRKNCLHMTLCTVGLDTPEQVANCSRVLHSIKSELSQIVPKDKTIRFKGVDNFFNRVLYAKSQCPPEFLEYVDHLKCCLGQEGIDIRDSHDFVPHMTIMKVSRPVARSTGKKYIDPWLYSSFNDLEFGTQAVDNLVLCSMGIDRQDDGFYITAATLDFNQEDP